LIASPPCQPRSRRGGGPGEARCGSPESPSPPPPRPLWGRREPPTAPPCPGTRRRARGSGRSGSWDEDAEAAGDLRFSLGRAGDAAAAGAPAAGLGWFGRLVDGIWAGAVAPLWDHSTGTFHLDISRPTRTRPGPARAPPEPRTGRFSAALHPTYTDAGGLERPSLVPAFLRRVQRPRTRGPEGDPGDAVSPISGGRVRILRHLSLFARPDDDDPDDRGGVENEGWLDVDRLSGPLAGARGKGRGGRGEPLNPGGAPRGAGGASGNPGGAPRDGPPDGDSFGGGHRAPEGRRRRAGRGGRPPRPWWREGGSFLWRRNPPLDLAAGVEYSFDYRRVEPVARVRVGDYVKVKAWPEPTVSVRGTWTVPGTVYGRATAPLALTLHYECPARGLGAPLSQPATLNVLLNYEVGSGVFLTPGAVETDWTVQTPRGARLRVAGGLRFPRRFPLDEGEDVLEYEVRRLGVEVPW